MASVGNILIAEIGESRRPVDSDTMNSPSRKSSTRNAED